MSALKLVAEDSTEINLRGVLSDEDLKRLHKRNEERAAAAKAKLGRDWTCHPTKRVPKKADPGVLDHFRKKHV